MPSLCRPCAVPVPLIISKPITHPYTSPSIRESILLFLLVSRLRVPLCGPYMAIGIDVNFVLHSFPSTVPSTVPSHSPPSARTTSFLKRINCPLHTCRPSRHPIFPLHWGSGFCVPCYQLVYTIGVNICPVLNILYWNKYIIP